MESEQDLYNELTCYSLSHPDRSFLHQHVVDAAADQLAGRSQRAIGVIFALVGLYLYIEMDFTGKRVQGVHPQLAKRRQQWPQLTPPRKGGDVSVRAVMTATPGKGRDEMIRRCCASVWNAWARSLRPDPNHS